MTNNSPNSGKYLDNLIECNIILIYCSNTTKINHEISKLSNDYSNCEYDNYIHYTTYKISNQDYEKIEIIKNNKVINNFTEKIGKNQTDFLN